MSEEQGDSDNDNGAEVHTVERARAMKLQRLASRDSNETAAADPTSWMQLPNLSIGSALQQSLLLACRRCKAGSQECSDSLKTLFNRFLKQKRPVINEFAEAQMQQASRYQVKTGLQEAACFVVLFAMFMMGAVLLRISAMAREVSSSSYKAVMLVIRRKYDETPSKIGVHSRSNERIEREQNATAKIMQSRLQMTILVKHKPSDQFFCLESTLPSWLVAIDRTTAENTKKVQQEHLKCIPELTESSKQFPVYIHQVCTDKYAANLRAESSMAAEMQHGIISHYSCDIHKVAIIQAKVLRFVSGHVSALIAGALALSESGCLRSLRKSLEAVLEQKLKVAFGSPPDHGYNVSYRTSVVDAFLPIPKGSVDEVMQSSTKKRTYVQRWIVSFFFNDDIQDKQNITFWTPHWQVQRHNVLKLMYKFLVPALLPSKPPLFLRAKWTGFQAAYEWFGLVAMCHGLLEATITHFFGSHLPTDPAGVEAKAQALHDEGEAEAMEEDRFQDAAMAILVIA